jgi:hypothetical protein
VGWNDNANTHNYANANNANANDDANVDANPMAHNDGQRNTSNVILSLAECARVLFILVLFIYFIIYVLARRPLACEGPLVP